MKRLLLVAALLVVILPAVALAHGNYRHSNHRHHGYKNPPVVQPVPTIPPVVVPPVQTPNPPVNGEKSFQAYLTGYSFWDNTPPGSADISNPVIHSKAGGTGTFNDPITIAVGHSIINGKDILDYPAGTKFYIPNLHRYAIVEDTCGDGNSPQNGPCHTGHQGHPWLDIYVGKGASKQASDACMDSITEVHTIIQNPIATYPVVTGDISATCTQYDG